MENILEKAKKDLRTYAKQNKKISFSIASAVSLLMTGTVSNADEIIDTKKAIDNTVDTVNSTIKALRRSNEKLLRDRNLELVELEEQGNQVIKSIWDSWQFGTEFTYDSQNLKGNDNKTREYGEQFIYSRDPWWIGKIKSESSNYGKAGSASLKFSPSNVMRNSLITNKLGVSSLVHLNAPESLIEVAASITPKDVPPVVIPVISSPNIPTAPSIVSVTPTISAPPAAPKVNIPVVKPINVTVSAPGAPGAPTLTPPNLTISTNIALPTVTLSNVQIANLKIDTSKVITTVSSTTNITTPVTISNSGFAGIGGIRTGNDTLNRIVNNMTTITMDGFNSVGLGYIVSGKTAPTIAPTIPGTKGSYISSGGVSEFRNNGIINVNSQSSGGVVIIPDLDLDPGKTGSIVARGDGGPDGGFATGQSYFGDYNNVRQRAFNATNGIINVSGSRSYGLVSIPRVDVSGYNFGVASNYNDSTGLYNDGTINISGDESTGFTILQPVQLAFNNPSGIINVGLSTPTQTPLADLGGSVDSATFVERASALYSEVSNIIVGDPNNTSPNLRYIGEDRGRTNGTINILPTARYSSAMRVNKFGNLGSAGETNIYGNNNYGGVAQGNGIIQLINDKYHNKNKYGNYYTPNVGINVFGNNSVGFYITDSGTGYIGGGKLSVGIAPGSMTNSAGVDTPLNLDSGSANGSHDSVGVYMTSGNFSLGDVTYWDYELDYGKIITAGVNNHALIMTGGNSNISGYINNRTENTVGIYAKDATFNIFNVGATSGSPGTGVVSTNGQNAMLKSGKGAIGIIVENTAVGNFQSGNIIIEDTIATATSVAVASDGLGKMQFGAGANLSNTPQPNPKLTLGIGSVGLYAKGGDTGTIFPITKLDVKLANNSIFAYLSNAKGSTADFANVNFISSGTGVYRWYAANNSVLTFNGESATNSTVTLSSSMVPVNYYAAENSGVINKGTVNSSLTTGLYAFSLANRKFPDGTNVTVDNTKTFVTNEGTINTTANNAIGVYTLHGTLTNDKVSATTIGTINTAGTSSVGMYGDEESLIINKGIINLNGGTSTGIFARGDSAGSTLSSTNKINILNTGTINVNGQAGIGIYALNNATTTPVITNSIIKNSDGSTKGEIILKGGNSPTVTSVGIYAPYSKIEQVGKITIDPSNSTSSVGIYADNKTEVDTSTGEVDLNKTNQSQVAYYFKGDGTVSNDPTIKNLSSGTIGLLKGHGVGLVVDNIKILDSNYPALDYTSATGATGDGIIGLVLKNNTFDTSTSILGYTRDIKVGSSQANTAGTDTDYAVALYSDHQGTSTTPLQVSNTLSTSVEGVGLFAENESHLKYSGTINIGDNTKSGTAIYVGKNTNPSSVELSNTTINLNGTSGVGAIVMEGAKLKFDNTTTMNFKGDGVAVYSKKGAIIVDGGLVINNTDSSGGYYAVERVRTEEGRVDTGLNVDLLPKNILSHSVIGQVNIIGATTTIKSHGDKVIALYAEGNKDDTAVSLWYRPTDKFDAINEGVIDFTVSTTSGNEIINPAGMYLDSSRGLNEGTIKVGSQGTAMYGEYNPNTVKVTGVSVNDTILKNGISGKIEIGKGAVGMYGNEKSISTPPSAPYYGIKTLINEGSIKAVDILSNVANATVGMYRAGELDPLLTGQVSKMENNGTIELKKGSIGMFGKTRTLPSGSTYYNEILNNGSITVGDELTITDKSVGIYAENSKVTNSSTGTITVGDKGIAFFGDNSEININGTVNMSNNGIMSIAQNNSIVNYTLGNRTTTSLPFMYVINSTANMNNAEITVANTSLAAYQEGTITALNKGFIDWNKLILRQDSTGIYGKDTTLSLTTNQKIESTDSKAKAIIGNNTKISNSAVIDLIGDESIGIYAENNILADIDNGGTIKVIGDKSTGIYANNTITGLLNNITNNGIINVGNSLVRLAPIVGIYGNAYTITSNNILTVGSKSIGIYSNNTNTSSTVTLGPLSTTTIGDEATGIYKIGGKINVGGIVNVNGSLNSVLDTTGTIGVYAENGVEITNSSTTNIGDSSFGFVMAGTGTNKFTSVVGTTASLGTDSIYVYSNSTSGGLSNIIENNTVITSSGDRNIALYGANGEKIENNANIDFSSGKGNVGIYTVNGEARNNANISVGASYSLPPADTIYSVGLGAKNAYIQNGPSLPPALPVTGSIAGAPTITVKGNAGIGMYGKGLSSSSNYDVVNNGNIILDPTSTMGSIAVKRMIGMYLEDGARGVNYGYIGTNGNSFSGNSSVNRLIGVAVIGGGTKFENYGKIEIDSDNGIGILVRGTSPTNLAIIKNYGEIVVKGQDSVGISYVNAGDTSGNVITLANAISQINGVGPLGSLGTVTPSGSNSIAYKEIDADGKAIGSVEIKRDPVTGEVAIYRNGAQVTTTDIEKLNPTLLVPSNIAAFNNVGIYVDTLGRTKPLGIDPSLATWSGSTDLVIGTEVAETVNAKNISVSGKVLDPFNTWINAAGNVKLGYDSGSLTWNAKPEFDTTGSKIINVLMAKIPYTEFAGDKDTFNFSEGLEQRYGIEAIGTKEKMLFNKLNDIGKGEESLLAQSFDEIRGNQYANTKVRIHNSSDSLDRGFEDLLAWGAQSKDSNKIKLIGGVSESQTDTAGILDYDNNNTGVVYLREDETMNLGKSQGWYAGLLYDRYKFKDIGKSTEDGVTTKVGLYKSIPFDLNNSLNWTIKGDVEAGTRNMHRKYLVVDTIFNAQSTYYTYGASLSNELSKSIRLSKGWTLKPYGALDLGYGAYTDIKENKGEMRLELKSSSYNSIKPSAGAELSYKAPITRYATFGFALGGKYEHELGKIAESKNQVKVRYTTADYYNLRTEKAEKGNGSFDVNMSIENSKVGFTLGGTYKTSGEFTGNTGIRWIF